MAIVPVILSGGAGTRLWPMSTPARPKQLLPLTGAETMLQMTAARVADRGRFEKPVVVANARHEAEIATQLGAAGAGDALLILEPAGRNTAPAIALAAYAVDRDALLLVMPSDHLIADLAAFHAAIDAGAELARDGWLVTFGMTPTAPETGFGYIERGEALAPGADAARRFVEKPDAATAAAYLATGRFLWNAGIFLFGAGAFIDALDAFAPQIGRCAADAMARAQRRERTILPDADAFAASPSVSVDVAVMERSDRVAVVPASMGWSDVGSWDALHDVSLKDADGSSFGGDVHAIDCSDLLVRAEGVHVSVIDVHGITVIATGDSVLIMPRGASQRVREAVDALTARRGEN